MSRRIRRRITYVALAVDILIIAAVIGVPHYRHTLPAGGWPLCIICMTGIGGGLSYLVTSRGRS